MADLTALALPSSPPSPPHRRPASNAPTTENARAPAPPRPPAPPSLDDIEIAPLTAASLQPVGRGRARRRALSPAQGRPGALERRRRSRRPLRVPAKGGKTFYQSGASSPSPLPSNCSSADFSHVPDEFPCNWTPHHTDWVEEVQEAEFGVLYDHASVHSISANLLPVHGGVHSQNKNAHNDVCSQLMNLDDSSTRSRQYINTFSHELSPAPSTRHAPPPTVAASRDDALESFFDDNAIEGVRMLFHTASDPLPVSPSVLPASPSVPSVRGGRRKSKKEHKRLVPRPRRGRHHIEHWYARAILPDVPPDPFQHGLLVLPYSVQPGSKLHNDNLRRRGSPLPQRRNSTHPLLGRRFPSPPRDVPHHTPLVTGRTLLPLLHHLLHHSWRRHSPQVVNARGIHFLVDSGTPDSVIPHWLHANLVQRNAAISPDGNGLFLVTFTTGDADVPLHVKIADPGENCMPTIGFDDIQCLNIRIEPSSRRIRFTPPNGPRTHAVADFEQVPAPVQQVPDPQGF